MDEKKRKEALELLAECDQAISDGNTDRLATREDGMREVLSWLLEDGSKPTVGLEW